MRPRRPRFVLARGGLSFGAGCALDIVLLALAVAFARYLLGSP